MKPSLKWQVMKLERLRDRLAGEVQAERKNIYWLREQFVNRIVQEHIPVPQREMNTLIRGDSTE